MQSVCQIGKPGFEAESLRMLSSTWCGAAELSGILLGIVAQSGKRKHYECRFSDADAELNLGSFENGVHLRRALASIHRK